MPATSFQVPASLACGPGDLKASTSNAVPYAVSLGGESSDDEYDLDYDLPRSAAQSPLFAVDSYDSSPSSTPLSSPVVKSYSHTDKPTSLADGVAAVLALQDGIPADKERDRRGLATFHLKAFEVQTYLEAALTLGVAADAVYRAKPDIERGPVQTISHVGETLWILPRALGPAVLQQASMYFFPTYTWPVWLSYNVHIWSFFFFMTASVKRFNRYALEHGTLDEKNFGRDRPVDRNVEDLFWLNTYFITGRIFVDFYMNWSTAHVAPIASFTWSFPIRLFLYLFVLDYLFYCYHRLAHDTQTLWRFHATHHGTKHPSPLLSIDAISLVAATVEFLVLPFLLAMIVPMTFHELYVAICYCAFTEAAGHSGIRAIFPVPITSPVLQPFGLEITVEDHDLHHRYGRAGKNFGKQTQVSDVIFGTRMPREETPDQIFPWTRWESWNNRRQVPAPVE